VTVFPIFIVARFFEPRSFWNIAFLVWKQLTGCPDRFYTLTNEISGKMWGLNIK
jgi:hypothetical protein